MRAEARPCDTHRMRLAVAVRIGVVVLALGLVAGACGDSGDDDDDRECGTCAVSEDCEGDQECVLATDDNLRCFEPDRDQCVLGRVTIGRAPAPTPTP